MSRATEGFSASTATLPDSAATIVLLQFSGSGTDERLLSSVKLRALAMVDHATRRSVPPSLQFRKFANRLRSSAENESRPLPGRRWIMPISSVVRRTAGKGPGQVLPAIGAVA